MKTFIQYLQEAEIYSSEQMLARGRSPEAAAKRAAFLKNIEGSKDPALVRVAADIRDTGMPSPGSEKVEAARAANRAAKEKYKGVYGTDFPEEGMADISDMRKAIAAGKNVDMTPDNFDGPDMGDEGSSEEVESAQQQNQFTGNIQRPFPTPAEMTANFFAQGRKIK